MNSHPLADYRTDLLGFLKIKESFTLGRPYVDTSTKHLATIGFGFNIEEKKKVRRKRCQEPLSDLTVVD